MSGIIGAEFARALAAKDDERLRALIADRVDFRALTPRRHWEAATPEEVVDEVVLGHWFATQSHIQELVSVTTGRVCDCEHVAYRLRVHKPDGDYTVEQQAYYTVHGGQIDWMRVLCSGYRLQPPVPACSPPDGGPRQAAKPG